MKALTDCACFGNKSSQNANFESPPAMLSRAGKKLPFQD
jgi:hypothetical protein